ncbi:MAG TPA: hypothetical protein VIR31_05840 [Nitrososphaeraceae archaeon]
MENKQELRQEQQKLNELFENIERALTKMHERLVKLEKFVIYQSDTKYIG